MISNEQLVPIGNLKNISFDEIYEINKQVILQNEPNFWIHNHIISKEIEFAFDGYLSNMPFRNVNNCKNKKIIEETEIIFFNHKCYILPIFFQIGGKCLKTTQYFDFQTRRKFLLSYNYH